MRKDQIFFALHQTAPGFIMPNAWDAGSAKILAQAGFPAIATTSSGIAFSLGKQDYGVTQESLRVPREQMFARIGEIVEAVDIPVSGDLEAGYGDAPERVAETIVLAMKTGLAGGNIEDRAPGSDALYDIDLAVERIAAARRAIDDAGSRFVLTARCDAMVWGGSVEDAIHRSNRYREAGADCLFTPGTTDLTAIRRLASEIDGPLNMVLGLGGLEGDAPSWIGAGVQRISLGGAIARSALGFTRRAAQELRTAGSIGFAAAQIQQPELNALFGGLKATV